MTIERGQPMLASDILDLTFFPIGMILMMDGSWTDGRGGWYICDGRDTPHGKTPNLADKFIRGGASAGGTGGGSATLSEANLPSHSHGLSGTFTTENANVTHTHTVTATGSISGGNHSHDITDPGHSHTLPYYVPNYDGYQNGKISLHDSCGPKFNYTNSGKTGITGTNSSGHTHTFTGSSATTFNSTDTGHTHSFTLSGGTISNTGSGSAFDVTPAYYTMIYIKKMA
jgi:hypothetical protein